MRRALTLPTKYVQGEDELLNLGYFVSTLGKKALLIADPADADRIRPQLEEIAKKFDITFVEGDFSGEVTREETKCLQSVGQREQADCIIGLGGGKVADASKVVAEGENLIIVSTIAAQDTLISYPAVLYHEGGPSDDYAYFKQSPSVAMVDTKMVTKASTRFLVAGTGDALSIYFEARVIHNSHPRVDASSPMDSREGLMPATSGTYAALAMAKLCWESLQEDGLKVKLACDANVVTESLNKIIETNILLSGLGLESSGLVAACTIHNGITVLPGAHSYLHDEKVAFAAIARLVLEDAARDELEVVLDFSAPVGLLLTLSDAGVDEATCEGVLEVVKIACIPEELTHSMLFPIVVEEVASVATVADKVGREYRTRHKLDQGSVHMKADILLVLHSKMITDDAKEMIEQMNASEEITIHSFGGTSDDPLGSDLMKIIDTISEADSDRRSLISADLGSAVLSSELVFDTLEEDQQKHYHLVDAPLVEGAFAAAITAGILDDLT